MRTCTLYLKTVGALKAREISSKGEHSHEHQYGQYVFLNFELSSNEWTLILAIHFIMKYSSKLSKIAISQILTFFGEIYKHLFLGA